MLPASGSSDSFLRHLKHIHISPIFRIFLGEISHLIWVVSLKNESFLLYFWWKCFFIVWNDFSRDLWKGISSEEIWCSWISNNRSNNGTWLANASTSFSFSAFIRFIWGQRSSSATSGLKIILRNSRPVRRMSVKYHIWLILHAYDIFFRKHSIFYEQSL